MQTTSCYDRRNQLLGKVNITETDLARQMVLSIRTEVGRKGQSSFGLNNVQFHFIGYIFSKTAVPRIQNLGKASKDEKGKKFVLVIYY